MKRIEQLHAAKLIHVTDIQPGDLIDTEGWWDPGTSEWFAAECELAEVDGIEPETETCLAIHFVNFPSYGWPTQQPILIQRRYNP
jgi:hypothetical protein